MAPSNPVLPALSLVRSPDAFRHFIGSTSFCNSPGSRLAAETPRPDGGIGRDPIGETRDPLRRPPVAPIPVSKSAFLGTGAISRCLIAAERNIAEQSGAERSGASRFRKVEPFPAGRHWWKRQDRRSRASVRLRRGGFFLLHPSPRALARACLSDLYVN